MKKITFWLILVLVSPLSALLFAWILSLAWRWFMATQYGQGPSYQSWYGISLLWTLISWGVTKKSPEDITPLAVTSFTISSYLGMFAVLLLSAFVRFALGWS